MCNNIKNSNKGSWGRISRTPLDASSRYYFTIEHVHPGLHPSVPWRAASVCGVGWPILASKLTNRQNIRASCLHRCFMPCGRGCRRSCMECGTSTLLVIVHGGAAVAVCA